MVLVDYIGIFFTFPKLLTDDCTFVVYGDGSDFRIFPHISRCALIGRITYTDTDTCMCIIGVLIKFARDKNKTNTVSTLYGKKYTCSVNT